MVLPRKWLYSIIGAICIILFIMCKDKILEINKTYLKDSKYQGVQHEEHQTITLKPSLQTFNVTLKSPLNLNFAANASGADLENMFAAYSNATEVVCPQTLRLGNGGDGGWSICAIDGYALQKPCLVYSFGINNDWSFDDAVVQRFGCTVRSFDPSMAAYNQRRGTSIFFYKEGLAGKDEITNEKMWRLNTLSSIRKIFNEQNATIDYLKIDIEYYEWESLETAIKDGSIRFVKQLGFEIHTDELYKRTTSVQNYQRFLKIFVNLREAGFYKWYTHLNPMSAVAVSNYTKKSILCCYEFVYINTNFG